MSQRSLLDDDEEIQVRSSAGPWARFGFIDRWRYDCTPCRGSGWQGFVSSGGIVCHRCGGSGRDPERHKTKRILLT